MTRTHFKTRDGIERQVRFLRSRDNTIYYIETMRNGKEGPMCRARPEDSIPHIASIPLIKLGYTRATTKAVRKHVDYKRKLAAWKAAKEKKT